MTIDTSGEWWTGTECADIESYLRELEPGGYPVDRVIQAKCPCGATHFTLLVDADNELAKTTCVRCGRDAFVADSGEHWDEAAPTSRACRCDHSECEVGLGLCIRESTWVRWMSLGVRCLHCGVLGSPLDWKSDLDLNDAAATRIGQ